jgi:hypothetical protein
LTTTNVNAIEMIAALLAGVLLLLVASVAPGLARVDVAEPTVIGERTYVNVELDIFSGRPNPRWTVEADQIAPMLPDSDTPQLDATGDSPGLGYRGFVLTLGSTETGGPAVYRVYAGEVSVGAGDEQTSFVDEKRLEAWLLEDARQRGYGDLLEGIAVAPRPGGADGRPGVSGSAGLGSV